MDEVSASLSGVWPAVDFALYRLFLHFSVFTTRQHAASAHPRHMYMCVSHVPPPTTQEHHKAYTRDAPVHLSLYLTCHHIQCHNSQSHPPSCAHIDTTDCVWRKPESTCLDTSLVTPMKDALPARGLSASHTHHARLKFPRLRHLQLPLAPAIPSRVPRGHVGRMPPPACRYRVR